MDAIKGGDDCVQDKGDIGSIIPPPQPRQLFPSAFPALDFIHLAFVSRVADEGNVANLG